MSERTCEDGCNGCDECTDYADEDLFHCNECGHRWDCYLDHGGPTRYECPVCGHDTGVESPPYAVRPTPAPRDAAPTLTQEPTQ